MTHEQARVLEAIKNKHGQLRHVPEQSSLGDELLSQCVSDSYAYQCVDCEMVFTIEPDGETDVWMALVN